MLFVNRRQRSGWRPLQHCSPSDPVSSQANCHFPPRKLRWHSDLAVIANGSSPDSTGGIWQGRNDASLARFCDGPSSPLPLPVGCCIQPVEVRPGPVGDQESCHVGWSTGQKPQGLSYLHNTRRVQCSEADWTIPWCRWAWQVKSSSTLITWELDHTNASASAKCITANPK